MDNLKKLRCSRRGHKSHLAKLLSNTDEIVEKLATGTLSDTDTASLEDYRKQLKHKAGVFVDIDQKIIDYLDDEAELEAMVLDSEDLQTALSQKISLVTHHLAAPRSQVTPQTSATNRDTDAPPVAKPQTSATPTSPSVSDDRMPPPTQSHHVTADAPPLETIHESSVGQPVISQYVARLPKLDVPSFAGDPLKWQSFWDCFEAAIHLNPHLSEVQKLSYLRAQLNGEATMVIAGLPLTNANYQHSVSLLKERYGQPHKLISAHVQALLELPKPINKLTSLQLFHDTVEGHIRCLQSLGKSPDALETLLVPIMLGKLPEETKKNMARAHESSQWTVQQLQMSLLKEIQIFETGQQASSLGSQERPLPTASFHTGADRKPGHRRREQTNKQPMCVYCKGSHHTSNCEVHKDLESRLAIIKQEKLCFNCLAHHRVSQCGSKNRCRKCNAKHHTSICNKPASKGTTESEEKEQPNLNSTTTTLTAFVPPQLTRNTICLLKAAIATVVNANLQVEANILFDEGSQRSFITEKLAGMLGVVPQRSENINLSSFGSSQPLYRRMDNVTFHIKTRRGDLVPISALVVPTIAAPLANTMNTAVTNLLHLKGLPLAHPVSSRR